MTKTIDVRIPYRPRFPQTEIHPMLETHRFSVLVTHRQMGKTVCAINHLLRMAITNPRPNAKYFYIAPFYNQAKMLAWDYLRRYTAGYAAVNVGTDEKPVIKNLRQINEQESKVVLPNGAMIRICGADNPDALRGNYADGVVLDEYGDIKPSVFTEIVRPMLLSRQGWAVFLGTPKGQNQFYDVYLHAAAEFSKNPKGDWWAGMYRADETGVIDPSELEQIRQETAENIFNREYLCDFSTAAEDCVFTSEMLRKAELNDFNFTGGERIAALDLARYGADNTVLAVWEYAGPNKWKEVSIESWNGKDAMYTVGRVAEASKQYKFNRLVVDGDGMGGPVVDRLREVVSFQVTEFRGGHTADDTERFANKRAETYFSLRDFFEKGYVELKHKPSLTELATVTFSFNSKGQIKMFSKEELKKQGGKSPDYADAVMMSAVLFKRSNAVHFRGNNSRRLTAYSGFDF